MKFGLPRRNLFSAEVSGVERFSEDKAVILLEIYSLFFSDKKEVNERNECQGSERKLVIISFLNQNHSEKQRTFQEQSENFCEMSENSEENFWNL